MKSSKKTFFSYLAVSVSAFSGFLAPADASIVFNFRADRLDLSIGTAAPSSSLILLVADTQNNGFNASFSPGSISAGSFLGGSDDLVLFRTSLAAPGVLFSAPELDLGGGWTTGDRLALYWFPTLTTASTTATAGDSFGSFLTGNVNNLDGSDSWITPAEGASGYNLFFFTTDGGTLVTGSHSASSGNASQTVVPEPSACLLLAFSGMALLGLRRRTSGNL